MLRSRWLSTFTVIGAILIVLGIVGLILGPRFVYDPGQPVTGKEAWCYLAIGVLMVLNGILTPSAKKKSLPRASLEARPRPGRRTSRRTEPASRADRMFPCPPKRTISRESVLCDQCCQE